MLHLLMHGRVKHVINTTEISIIKNNIFTLNIAY